MNLLFDLEYLVSCPFYMKHHKNVLTSTKNHFYHYTSPEGFFGIFNEKSIWATDFRSLNDSEEFFHAYKLLNQIFDNDDYRNQLSPEIQALVPDLKKLFMNWVSEEPVQLENIFISSFSNKEDDLSQWRAYCNKGGYCIGFPLKVIRDTVTLFQKTKITGITHRIYLLPCVYDDSLKFKIISNTLHQCYEKNKNCNPSDFPALYYRAFKIFGSIFKHSAFSEENEFRIILEVASENQKNTDQISANMRYRISKGKITPYFNLPLDFSSLPINADKNNYLDIRISSNYYDEKSKNNTWMFVSSKVGESIVIRKSSNPYIFINN